MIPLRFKGKRERGRDQQVELEKLTIPTPKGKRIDAEKLFNLVGALHWECVKCGCLVTAEQRPTMSQEYKDFIEKIFDAKLCSVCFKASIRS